MNIEVDLNSFKNLKIQSKADININNYKTDIPPKSSEYIYRLTTKKKQNLNIKNKKDIKSSKTIMQTKNKENINNISDNLFDEYKTIQSYNLIEAKFIKLSANPFITKTEEKIDIVSIEANKDISQLKRNLNENNRGGKIK